VSAELYAESSAVLGWLLGEPSAGPVRENLASAPLVVVSELTLIECDRVLHRAVALGELAEADAATRRALLARASEHWAVFRLEAEVTERSRRPFPCEPIRTLDAIHLATALVARSLIPGLILLSLDTRVRDSGAALGFKVVPQRR
jgi:predicted nucleic acid-binding protein